MVRQLKKTADGWTLVLDEATLDAAHIDPEQGIEVTVEDRKLTVVPIAPTGRKKDLETAMREMNEKHAGAFKRLA